GPPTGVYPPQFFRRLEERRLPAIGNVKAFAAAGGLMSYGADNTDLFRRSATYVDRILRGDRPGDLPVQFPTRFEMVLNLKTAKAIGVTLPSTCRSCRRSWTICWESRTILVPEPRWNSSNIDFAVPPWRLSSARPAQSGRQPDGRKHFECRSRTEASADVARAA